MLSVKADAAAILAAEGREGFADPVAELASLAVEAKAFMRAAGARTNALGEEIRYRDDKGAEQLRAEVALFERAMDRLGKLLEVLTKRDYSERVIRLAERELDMLDAVLRLALSRAGLSDVDQARVIEVVPVVLGEIVGGGV